MAGKITLSRLSISFLLALHICFAKPDHISSEGPVKIGNPSFKMEAEAGVTEFWDDQVFRWAGGSKAIRRTIEQKGLLLPYYSDNDQVSYIVQGSGVGEIMMPWCPDTSKTKIKRIRAGDVFAVPAGVALWLFNDGDQPITIVSVSAPTHNNYEYQSSSSSAIRNFYGFQPFTTSSSSSFYYIAGNPLGTSNTKILPKMASEETPDFSNIFSGFDPNILAESFNIEPRLSDSLGGKNDLRGDIVQAKAMPRAQFGLITVDIDEQHKNVRSDDSSEEDLCTMKLKENIMEHCDFNFSGGFIMAIDRKIMPALHTMHISVQRGVLCKNAYMAPHWEVNAHSIVYITRGSARVEIVDNRGKSVFDGKVKTGQILVVPRNNVVLQKAGREGVEWIAFVSNDWASVSQLGGVLNAMPEELLMDSYQVSRDDAVKLRSLSSKSS